jgi:ubiquinone/menaquinone biosynthesis C-methylase UbiE
VKRLSLAWYRCPADGTELKWEDASSAADVESGSVLSASGRRYQVRRGVPHLLHPEALSGVEEQTQSEYDRVADGIYDVAVDWQFASFLEDEDTVREAMVDLLRLLPHHRVLEVGCGTGRDSFRLARRLDARGLLFMQDLSANMVQTCVQKMRDYAATTPLTCGLEYSVSNATALPFPDGMFDAVFHFGGFNQFGDLRRGAAELSRVTRVGGRVLIGDEAVAPWLKGTEFERIVTTNNALFKADAPLHVLPESARDVTVKWLIGNCFYVFAFTKGEGPPPLNLDLPHQGWRGGTMRTRYYGQLEGVTPEAKALARDAAAAAGVSVHEWLDTLVKNAADQALKR